MVYEQHVLRFGGERYDPANQMPLCVECHRGHHDRVRVLPVFLISDEAIAFGVALFGAALADYLGRRYALASEDPRLLALLTPPAGSSGTQDGGGP